MTDSPKGARRGNFELRFESDFVAMTDAANARLYRDGRRIIKFILQPFPVNNL